MSTASMQRYGLPARMLHWGMAALIIALIGVGIYMTGLDKADPARRDIYNMHKAVGALVLGLLVIRIIWFRLKPAPELPDAFSAKEKAVTRGLQGLIYILMLAVPVSGYVMSTAAGYPVSFFGLFELPALLDKSKTIAGFAHEGHEISAYVLLALVFVHVAGAVKHRVADKGGPRDIMGRML